MQEMHRLIQLSFRSVCYRDFLTVPPCSVCCCLRRLVNMVHISCTSREVAGMFSAAMLGAMYMQRLCHYTKDGLAAAEEERTATVCLILSVHFTSQTF